MNKREEQSEYVPPDNALHLHGQGFNPRPVLGEIPEGSGDADLDVPRR